MTLHFVHSLDEVQRRSLRMAAAVEDMVEEAFEAVASYDEPLARRVIEWSNAPRPTSLRHDAAEAILIGLWGVLQAGQLPRLPTELRP